VTERCGLGDTARSTEGTAHDVLLMARGDNIGAAPLTREAPPYPLILFVTGFVTILVGTGVIAGVGLRLTTPG